MSRCARCAATQRPTFAALATVTVTLIVVGVFIPIVQATQGAANGVRDKVLVEAYMKLKATPQEDARVRKELKAIPNVRRVVFESKAQALVQEKKTDARCVRPPHQQPASGHLPRLSDEPVRRARGSRRDRRLRARAAPAR